ncbi:MAG: hypothetical protein PUP91_14130 [Rhizonema sp. PD37]|nr:hypothetical protein [Rhizonema sp. PD37]
MTLLMEAAAQAAAKSAQNAPHFPVSATLVYVAGFIAAITIGSIAWYNSKRPPGAEGNARPSFVPKVEKEETPGLGDPKP